MKVPLKFQDQGPDVVELQKLLNRNAEAVTVDRIFGNETLAAVEDFQSTHTDSNGNPLVVDGVVGPLTRDSLLANAVEVSFAGFDIGVYPGDEIMTSWVTASPYKWVGYYLTSPFHQDATFMGTRAKLEALGWGLAVLYVGRQVSSKPENQTRQRGLADGQDTIQKVQGEGFAANTIVYLDIEHMDVVPSGIKEYLKGWIASLLQSRFRPGIYCHIKNAQELRVAVKEEYEAENSSLPLPAFWVAGSGAFDPANSVPSDSGIAFAAIWQGRLNHPETYGGFSRKIDANVAISANPSAMASMLVAGGGA